MAILLHVKFVDCFLLVSFSRVKNRTWKVRLSITINQIKTDNKINDELFNSFFNILGAC